MAKVELKKPIVEEIAGHIDNAAAVVLVTYSGITVEQDTALRKELREAGICLLYTSILDLTHRELKNQVWEAFDDLEWEDGKLEIDSDFLEPEDGIYLSAYDSEGKMLGGRVPGNFNYEEELSEGLKKISLEGEEWYILDLSLIHI